MDLIIFIAIAAVGGLIAAQRFRALESKLDGESQRRRSLEKMVGNLAQRLQAIESARIETVLGWGSAGDASSQGASSQKTSGEEAPREEAPVREAAHAPIASPPPFSPAVPAPVPIPASASTASEDAGVGHAPPPIPAPIAAARTCQFCGRRAEPGRAICVCGAVLDYAAVRVQQGAEHAHSAVEAAPPPLPIGEPANAEQMTAAAHTFHGDAPPALPPLPVPSVPRVSMRDRLRQQIGDEGWEAMVGGSWLNKLGVLVLVIGIALLLGYEFGRVGPAARVAIGLGVSLTMLIGGVVVERRPAYAIFARGLIGGGWAALYFTTYAMHAVDAARVIDNPFVATGMLLAVAAGMIAHSLRYHSQTVTGLAYFIAFATLALGDSTPFSVIALIPLAGSLLLIAYRFEWYKMAVFGLFATYATCASRPDVGAPLASTEALFTIYWLLFETFDVLRARRLRIGYRAESLILPLNAFGFLTLSIVKWNRVSHERLWMLLAAGVAAYLASATIRALLVAPSRFPESSNTGERIASGGYEGPVTLAAALAAGSIFLKAAGMWINAGWLIEGEIIFLAGLWFGETYLRQLAGAVFAGSVAKLLLADVSAPDRITIAGHKWMRWTPVAIASSAVFYANRVLKRGAAILSEGAIYSSVAAALITVVLGHETHLGYLCVAWLAFAGVLFELGYRWGKAEFLIQSYVIGALGAGTGLFLNLAYSEGAARRLWWPSAVAAAILYAISLRIRFGGVERLRGAKDAVPCFTAASAAAYGAMLVWKLAPGAYLGAGWLILGAILFDLGLRRLPAQFRVISYAMAAMGAGNLAYFHVILANKTAGRAEPVSLAIGAAVACYFAARMFRPMTDWVAEIERESTRDLSTAIAALFAMTLAWWMLPPAAVAVAWGLIGLVLLELGFTFSLSRFRWLGNLASVVVFARLFFENFTDFGATIGIPHRILTVVPIVVSEYYLWWRYRQSDAAERAIARAYLWAPPILVVILMRFEFGRSMAVVGWAVFLLALYRIGIKKELVDLRWQSYAIALLTTWRCWNTNFYIPDSLAGMPARILTGAIVIACLYIAQLIAPRREWTRILPGEAAPEPAGKRWAIDRYARTFYSLLASGLLAVLLFYEVSGGALTMAWGVEALAILGAGFPLRDRVQRLSGLVLFMVCVLKLFLYDLRRLETINRILSFIVLGLILVSVSWVYTRFRDRIQKYL